MSKPTVPRLTKAKTKAEATKITTRPLTPQERRFVDAYDGGDPYEAVLAAGFEGTELALLRQGERLLAIPAVRRAVRAKAGYSPDLLDELDVKELLSRIALDPSYEIKDRLRATELYGKNLGMFVDRVKHEGNTLEALIQASFEVGVKTE